MGKKAKAARAAKANPGVVTAPPAPSPAVRRLLVPLGSDEARAIRYAAAARRLRPDLIRGPVGFPGRSKDYAILIRGQFTDADLERFGEAADAGDTGRTVAERAAEVLEWMRGLGLERDHGPLTRDLREIAGLD